MPKQSFFALAKKGTAQPELCVCQRGRLSGARAASMPAAAPDSALLASHVTRPVLGPAEPAGAVRLEGRSGRRPHHAQRQRKSSYKQEGCWQYIIRYFSSGCAPLRRGRHVQCAHGTPHHVGVAVSASRRPGGLRQLQPCALHCIAEQNASAKAAHGAPQQTQSKSETICRNVGEWSGRGSRVAAASSKALVEVARKKRGKGAAVTPDCWSPDGTV